MWLSLIVLPSSSVGTVLLFTVWLPAPSALLPTNRTIHDLSPRHVKTGLVDRSGSTGHPASAFDAIQTQWRWCSGDKVDWCGWVQVNVATALHRLARLHCTSATSNAATIIVTSDQFKLLLAAIRKLLPRFEVGCWQSALVCLVLDTDVRSQQRAAGRLDL